MQAEAEHNLLLGIARDLAESEKGYAPPVYLATIELDEAVVGCAFRTPPHKLGLTRMPLAAVPVLAEDLDMLFDWIPAVLGPQEEVQVFAEAWSRLRNIQTAPGMQQRIYRLETVTPPPDMPPGHLRIATRQDIDRIASWLAAFSADTGLPAPAPRQTAQHWVAQGSMYFWVDDVPVCMAGWTGRTPNGARIGYVYTPPTVRGRGYASACVATLSQRLLDAGLQFCALYTDLSNPTSNHIYQRIGYYPVCDVMDYDFIKPT